MKERYHKVEPCACGSKQLALCELFGKYSMVQCKECSMYGGMADTRLEAVKVWNKERLKNEPSTEEEEKACLLN